MKTSFEVGGPAFPQALLNDEGEVYYFHDWKGMSLRDYFAAKALQGLLSNPKLHTEILKQGGCQSGWIETSAWAFADEMIKARK